MNFEKLKAAEVVDGGGKGSAILTIPLVVRVSLVPK